MKKKIFCFVNSGRGTDMQIVIALCEDGNCLGQHLSSCEGWAKHDIGINSDWNHDNYKEHCPDGYELIWVDEPESSPEIDAAYDNNQKLATAAQRTEP